MMKISVYDDVLLKDGRKGTLIEQYDETHFMVDVSPSADEPVFEDIDIEDIQKVIRESKV